MTSKLWPSEYGEGRSMEGTDRMLERLDIGYIDYYLLHILNTKFYNGLDGKGGVVKNSHLFEGKNEAVGK